MYETSFTVRKGLFLSVGGSTGVGGINSIENGKMTTRQELLNTSGHVIIRTLKHTSGETLYLIKRLGSYDFDKKDNVIVKSYVYEYITAADPKECVDASRPELKAPCSYQTYGIVGINGYAAIEFPVATPEKTIDEVLNVTDGIAASITFEGNKIGLK